MELLLHWRVPKLFSLEEQEDGADADEDDGEGDYIDVDVVNEHLRLLTSELVDHVLDRLTLQKLGGSKKVAPKRNYNGDYRYYTAYCKELQWRL
ncbi:hypothetical protein AK812_SmicGene1227 [Symbiodinium microadriaticum]|uniref:Uncharacterized protein n=1 Tax=Symbiodinium microadriaticum TaxID=2951 RepID=A0A1Q9F4K6_SYMMI|nr:hypothetical protein AK812_SmicGene1227 [Symbiodinium microadriaticum]